MFCTLIACVKRLNGEVRQANQQIGLHELDEQMDYSRLKMHKTSYHKEYAKLVPVDCGNDTVPRAFWRPHDHINGHQKAQREQILCKSANNVCSIHLKRRRISIMRSGAPLPSSCTIRRELGSMSVSRA